MAGWPTRYVNSITMLLLLRFQKLVAVSLFFLTKSSCTRYDMLPHSSLVLIMIGVPQNYASPDVPPHELWGDQAAKLKALVKKYDPKDLNSLTGGWKF
jgi:hypothetical protein